jgi:radical SAM protein with 4Fe4S-binding SPASM domain
MEGDDLDRTIRVTASGEVFLTAYLDAEPFYLGVYQDGNLREMWYSPKVVSAFSEAARRRTSLPLCLACENWYWCRGGSAALAWVANDTFFSVDSYCAAKKAVAQEILGAYYLWRSP